MSGSVSNDVAAIMAGINQAKTEGSTTSVIGSTNIASTSVIGGTSVGPNSLPNVQAYNSAGTSGLPSSIGQTLATPNSPTGMAKPMVATDFRVRVSPLNTAFYGTTNPFTAAHGIINTGSSGTTSTGQLSTTTPGGANLLSPLMPGTGTNGVMFPFTPTISFEQSVDYSQTEMIQTNLTYEVYRRTPSVTITIQGKFTVQNQIEGQYAMAAIHFFRVASKMYFGTLAGANAGLPPPILLLNGYGTYMFNNLRCILKTHSYNYAENIDTVTVQVGGGVVRLPSMFDLSVTLTVQQTPQTMRSAFNLDAFRTGALMQTGGWI